jgi:hypothetical protein
MTECQATQYIFLHLFDFYKVTALEHGSYICSWMCSFITLRLTAEGIREHAHQSSNLLSEPHLLANAFKPSGRLLPTISPT